MTITNKGKPESRKRKLSDADPQSEEETTTVAPEKPVANKKKNKKNKKAQKSKAVHGEPQVADPQSSEETTTVAPEKPVANKKKNKQKNKKAQKSEAVHEEPQVADEDDSEDEGTNAGISTQRLKETPKSKSGSGSAASSKDADRRDERDRRTLFLKNLPGNCTVRHIKALSKDIKQVRLRSTFSVIENRKTRIGFAFVAFASEEAAEKNFKTLEAALIRGSKIKVDYVGEKSKFQSTKSKTEPANIDPLRLYVSGLPGDATQEDILKLFPGAIEVVLPKRNKDKLLFGYAFVGYADAGLAAQHHEKGQDMTLKGRKLVVLYARSRTGGSGKTSEKQKQKGTKVAAKQEVKMEQDGDDEEADDDDDEEDDDEEDDDDDDDDEEEDDE